MKINFLEPFMAPISGGLRRIIVLSNHLVGRGHDVTIFVPIQWVRKPKWIEFDNRIKIKPEKEWAKTKADVAVVNLHEHFGMLKNCIAKKKVYYLLHYEILYNNRNKDAYKDKKVNYIAVSNWVANEIGKINKRKIPVTYGGIDTNVFRPMDVNKKFDVLGFGNPVPWKGSKEFKEAMNLLSRRMKIKFKQFYGRDLNQEEVAEMYNEAKVFVSASYYEGWNNTALEAMACGTPLVCTDIPGNADFAVHKKNCLKVPPKDPKAIADAVERMLTEPVQTGLNLAHAGLDTAKQFSWSKVADKFEMFLNDIR